MQVLFSKLPPFPWANVSIWSQVAFHDFAIGYGDVSFDKICEKVYGDLQAYCSRNRLQLHMQALTRALLGFPKSSSFPAGCLGESLAILLENFFGDFRETLQEFLGKKSFIGLGFKTKSKELVQGKRHDFFAHLPWR